MRYGYLVVIGLLLINICACRKKDDPVIDKTAQSTTGSIKMQFSNLVDNKPLILDTVWYVNEAKDSFQVTTYKYYVSNLSFKNAAGKVYTPKQDYYLIDQADPTSKIATIDSIPLDNYVSVTFLIGVDSARNTMGIQTGALDPIHTMIWDWNTGFIMAKLEGNSPQSRNSSQIFQYHVAGYTGLFCALQWVTLPFPSEAKVTTTSTPTVHLFNNLNEWFKTPETSSISSAAIITTIGLGAQKLSINYADMFRVDHID